MTTRFRTGAILPLCALLGLAACAAKDDSPAMIESGKAYMAKADYKAAAIQLKNALQKSPGSGEARFLLAKSLLESGDAFGAETEIRKAIDLGYSGEDAYPVLASALLAQGEYRKLVTELAGRKLETPAARSSLATSVGVAQLALAEPAAARAAIDSALADKPDNNRALVIKASILAQSSDVAGAVKLVDAALAAAPDDTEALVLKSELQSAQGDREQSLKTLEHAIELKPAAVNLRFAIVSRLILAGQAEAAKTHVAAMQKVAPRDFRTLYSDALVSYSTGDFTHAREVVQQVLAAKPDDVATLYLSGLIHYQLQSFAAAEEALRNVISKAPDDVSSKRVLAAVYVRTGRPAQALDLLNAAMRKTPDDPALLRLAGEALLVSGNATKAAEYYEHANKVDSGNIASKVRLAQVRFATGDSARAMKDLATLSDADASQNQADLALITAHLRRREFDKALADVDALERKQPGKATTQNIRGLVYLAKRDLKSARQSFEQAFATDPKDFSAAYNLALIDLQEGKPEDARKRYEMILEKNPKNEQILLALADLGSVTSSGPDAVKSVIERAIAANPSSTKARLALINHYVRQRDLKGALSAAQAAQAASPEDAQLVEAVGNIQLSLGDSNQAQEAFRRWVQLQPNNPQALLRLAEAQVVGKDYTGAIASERKALALAPNSSAVWGALAKTLLLSGHPEDALAEGRKLQKDKPDQVLGYALEGQVYALQNKWPEAAAAFRTGMAKQPSPVLASVTYVALQRAGKPAEATALADRWIKDHPKDVAMRSLLAEQSQAKKDYKAALVNYKAALEAEPDSVALLNNIAWVLGETGDPTAQDYAMRAYRLAPFNASVVDTFGWTLVNSGDVAKGTPLLKMASNLAPTNNDIRLHYAKALMKSGDKVNARAQLDILTKLDSASPVRIEADKLMAEL